MVENVKDHKQFLIEHENKIKNLLIIMNNLLLKLKKNGGNNSDADGILNTVLFDKKVIDFKTGINENIIEDINNSISK